MWGLETVPEFKQWLDELDKDYHPSPKPLKQHYRDPPIPPSSTDVLRRVEYDQDIRFYLTRHDKWRDKKTAKILEFQKAQGWMYLHMSVSFTKTNMIKIQQFEATKFRKDFMIRNHAMLIDSPEVTYLPHGTLCYQTLKDEYVSSGPTSLFQPVS